MSTKFLSPGWRMPRNANQSKITNYSLDFDGSNYIDTSDSTLLSSENWSISVWFKWSALQIGGNNEAIISTRQGSIGAASGFDLYLTDSDTILRARTYSGNVGAEVAITLANEGMTAGVWYHASIVYDSGNLTFKINNGDIFSGSSTGNYTASSNSLTIGKWANGANYHNGKITEVSIFDYALSSSQVTTLWGGGTSVSNPMALPSPPIAYYPLGTSAYNGEYLAENNAIGDYVFDFDTSRIQVSNQSLGITSQIAISAWVKIPDGSTGGAAPNIQQIVSEDTTGGTSRNWILSWRGGSYEDFYFAVFHSDGTSTSTYSNVGDINDGKWHHVVGTWDGTTNANAFKIYVDNVATSTTSTKTDIRATSNIPTTIGAIPNAFTRAFDGNISNVQIWDTNLSSTDVETLYNYGSPIRTLANIPQSSSLKAWYKLDASEVYNSTTTEWSIDNNQNPSAYPSSLDFDASSSDYIQIPYNVNLTPQNGNFTISAWINTDNLSGWHPIWSTQNLSSGGRAVALHTFGNKVRATVGGSTNNPSYGGSWALLLDSTESLITSTWYHIAVSYDMSGDAQIYINGNTDNSGPIENPQTNWTTGDRFIGEGEGYWDGRISNLSIWNTALTSTQVTELYNNGTPSNLSNHSATSNLVSWWKLNNTTTGIEDSKGSNNGTNNGATEYTGFVNTLVGESSGMTQANLVQSDLSFTSGYSPYALDFDGTNDYIDCGDSDDFSFGDGSTDSPFSVSAWVNPDAVEYAGIVAKYVTGGWEWLLYLLDNNFLKFLLLNNNTSGNSIALTTDVAIPINTWTHVSATYNANGEPNGIDLYINGSLQSLVTESTSGTYQAMTNTTAPLQIGTWNGNFRPINGQISNVSIWDVKLTPTQVSEIYNEGVPQNLLNHSAVSSLVSWWQLGSNSSFDGNDWIVADEKGTNNGTSTGMPVGALVNGVGTTANGVSSGMSEGNLVGDAPYSTANALSTNMVITSRVSGVSDAAITTGGTGYVTGTNIATTGGSGTNCTINITTVSGGVITAITINNGGSNYVIGDVLTISGGNGNATITVSGLNTP